MTSQMSKKLHKPIALLMASFMISFSITPAPFAFADGEENSYTQQGNGTYVPVQQYDPANPGPNMPAEENGVPSGSISPSSPLSPMDPNDRSFEEAAITPETRKAIEKAVNERIPGARVQRVFKARSANPQPLDVINPNVSYGVEVVADNTRGFVGILDETPSPDGMRTYSVASMIETELPYETVAAVAEQLNVEIRAINSIGNPVGFAVRNVGNSVGALVDIDYDSGSSWFERPSRSEHVVAVLQGDTFHLTREGKIVYQPVGMIRTPNNINAQAINAIVKVLQETRPEITHKDIQEIVFTPINELWCLGTGCPMWKGEIAVHLRSSEVINGTMARIFTGDEREEYKVSFDRRDPNETKFKQMIVDDLARLTGLQHDAVEGLIASLAINGTEIALTFKPGRMNEARLMDVLGEGMFPLSAVYHITPYAQTNSIPPTIFYRIDNADFEFNDSFNPMRVHVQYIDGRIATAEYSVRGMTRFTDHYSYDVAEGGEEFTQIRRIMYSDIYHPFSQNSIVISLSSDENLLHHMEETISNVPVNSNDYGNYYGWYYGWETKTVRTNFEYIVAVPDCAYGHSCPTTAHLTGLTRVNREGVVISSVRGISERHPEDGSKAEVHLANGRSEVVHFTSLENLLDQVRALEEEQELAISKEELLGLIQTTMREMEQRIFAGEELIHQLINARDMKEKNLSRLVAELKAIFDELSFFVEGLEGTDLGKRLAAYIEILKAGIEGQFEQEILAHLQHLNEDIEIKRAAEITPYKTVEKIMSMLMEEVSQTTDSRKLAELHDRYLKLKEPVIPYPPFRPAVLPRDPEARLMELFNQGNQLREEINSPFRKARQELISQVELAMRENATAIENLKNRIERIRPGIEKEISEFIWNVNDKAGQLQYLKAFLKGIYLEGNLGQDLAAKVNAFLTDTDLYLAGTLEKDKQTHIDFLSFEIKIAEMFISTKQGFGRELSAYLERINQVPWGDLRALEVLKREFPGEMIADPLPPIDADPIQHLNDWLVRGEKLREEVLSVDFTQVQKELITQILSAITKNKADIKMLKKQIAVLSPQIAEQVKIFNEEVNRKTAELKDAIEGLNEILKVGYLDPDVTAAIKSFIAESKLYMAGQMLQEKKSHIGFLEFPLSALKANLANSNGYVKALTDYLAKVKAVQPGDLEALLKLKAEFPVKYEIAVMPPPDADPILGLSKRINEGNNLVNEGRNQQARSPEIVLQVFHKTAPIKIYERTQMVCIQAPCAVEYFYSYKVGGVVVYMKAYIAQQIDNPAVYKLTSNPVEEENLEKVYQAMASDQFNKPYGDVNVSVTPERGSSNFLVSIKFKGDTKSVTYRSTRSRVKVKGQERWRYKPLTLVRPVAPRR